MIEAIRDLTVAAPLKRSWAVPPLRGSPSTIRDLTVAAPLKPTIRRHDRRIRLCYPRPDGRGPIEARRLPTYWPSAFSSIRDLTVAAPLKPIARRASGRGSQTIRDLTVAAPLKPAPPVCPTALRRSYPRPDGRGPIEARR